MISALEIEELLALAIKASLAAGTEIMQIYATDDFSVSFKEDSSPLTRADMASNEIICTHLSKTKYPILSEEGKHLPYTERSQWRTLWIVDPIDGTKEFINKNDEFTVNIALVHDETPIMGVIFVPAKQELYYADINSGAFKVTEISHFSSMEGISRVAIELPLNIQRENYTIVASRSHPSKEVEAFIKQKEKEMGKLQLLSKGSSLKFCVIAEGTADCYPRFGPTMEWDTAAGQAICAASGATVIDIETNEPMKYNRENLLNNFFIVKR